MNILVAERVCSIVKLFIHYIAVNVSTEWELV